MINEEITESVLNTIGILKEDFENKIFIKYTGYFRNFESFYISGHCVSFAFILKELFDGDIYDDFDKKENIGHAIIKIQNHYYDASGIVDYLIEENFNNFSLVTSDYLPYFRENYSNYDEHMLEIEQELINIGKKSLEERKNNYHSR